MDFVEKMVAKTVLNSLWCHSESSIATATKKAENKISKYTQDKLSEIKPCSFTAEAGCTLSGVAFTHAPVSEKARKQIVFFNGNQGIWQTSISQLQKIHRETGANVVSYNYRGITKDTPFPTRDEDLINDGAKTVLDMIQKQGIQASDITLFGQSLGGAMSVCVAAKLLEHGVVVDVVADRTFSNVRNEFSKFLPFLGSLIGRLAQRYSWNLNAEEAIKKLEGRVIVLYHKGDNVIKLPASLKTAVVKNPNLKHVTLIKMKEDATPWKHDHIFFLRFFKAHGRPLNKTEFGKLKAAMAA